MALCYIKLFYDWLEVTAELTFEEKGRLIDALVAYARGEERRLTGNERFVFPMFRSQIDRDAAAYAEVSAKRRSAGSKGGRQRLANASRCNHEKGEGEDENEGHGEANGKENGKESRTMGVYRAPPAVDEIQRFMEELAVATGLTVDTARSAERFWNHRQGQGWNIRDWRPLAQNWLEEDAHTQRILEKSNPALAYEQRHDNDYATCYVDLLACADDELEA